ncbi:MAG TPA: hypothetical protein VEA37_11155 [Flavobacterium sp.]|nr:hypothetical protein [Flavobacterium sp.]
MTNLSKYCLLLDPSNPGVEFIIRTQPPIILGQVVHGNVEQKIRDHQPIAVGKPYEQNEWAVFFAGKLDKEPLAGTAQEQADQLAKIMRKMSDFYLHLKK